MDTAAAPSATAAATAAAPAPNGAPGAPIDPNAPPTEAARERRRIALAELSDDDEIVSVIDGKEHTQKAADWRRDYQRNLSATRRYQAAAAEREQARAEATRVRGEIDTMVSYLREPERLFAAILEAGGNPDAWAQQVMEVYDRERQLSPEARELRSMRMRAERERTENETRAKQAHAQQTQQLEGRFRRAFDAVSARAGIPQVPEIREAVDVALANAWQRALSSGTGITTADLVAVANQAYSSRRSAYAQHLDPESAKAAAARYAPPPSPVQPAPSRAAMQPRDQEGRFQEPRNQRRGSALDAVLEMHRR
jgi:hypothetical protein